MTLITQEDLDKLNEIAKLHDEAFAHYQKYDGHAKSSDGHIKIEIEFGTVWDRQENQILAPTIGVSIYSYVVASATPSYPNFGQRSHWFETIDEALSVMKQWHEKAMQYKPSEEELADIDSFAAEMLDVLSDKIVYLDIDTEPKEQS